MSELIVSTNTFWANFRDCRRFHKLRFQDELVPIEMPESLVFGTLLHDGLRQWQDEGLEVAAEVLWAKWNEKPSWEAETRVLQVLAMIEGYSRVSEPMQTVKTEHKFEIPLVNPKTGKASKTFRLAGKVDAILKDSDGKLWLKEYKSTSDIDAGYIARLWTETQPRLYVAALKRAGIYVEGILFDLLQKPRIKRKRGETDAQYEERRQKLIDQSTTGKTTAKKQEEESAEYYLERLRSWYREENRFHQEQILVSEDDCREIEEEVWDLSQAWIDARYNNLWYKNTSQCFKWNRPCQYFELCKSGGSELIKSTFFKKEAPNPELREE